jgi:hypothetical protein
MRMRGRVRAGHAGGRARNETARSRTCATGLFLMRCRRRPTLPRPLGRSTIGAVGLNDRVRDGNGCGPYALVASELRSFDCVSRWSDGGSQRLAGDAMASLAGPTDPSFCSATVSTMLTADDGRSWMSNPETMRCSACSLLFGSSQATRAIRTAALGARCRASTGGLSTGWSLPALQEG